MAKCLVTGGAGFIGSNLVDELIKRGDEVIIIDNLSTGKKEYINEGAKFFNIDINSDEIEKIFQEEKPDFVFHLAAQIDVRKSVEDPEFDNKINVLGGINILENCRKNNVKKFIFASTGGAVYGDIEPIPTTEESIPNPLSPYGIHKLTFEKYLYYYYHVYKQEYIALRFSNIYGPRQFKGGEAGVISIFIDNAVNNIQSTLFGDGTHTRDFVYVDDVVESFIKSMTADYIGEVNIGIGTETSMIELVDIIESVLGKKIDIKNGPARAGEQLRSCLDYKKAKEVLSWEPQISLKEGIEKTIAWSKNNKSN